jgi:hypothetical protein
MLPAKEPKVCLVTERILNEQQLLFCQPERVRSTSVARHSTATHNNNQNPHYENPRLLRNLLL